MSPLLHAPCAALQHRNTLQQKFWLQPLNLAALRHIASWSVLQPAVV